MKAGCFKHVLILAGLCVVGGFILFGKYGSTFRLMWANMNILSEGADWAEKMRAPEDFLAYLVAHPDQVSLVWFDIGQGSVPINHRGGVARPLAGVPRLLLLAEYDRQVAQGNMDPTAPVSIDTLRAYRLPGVGPNASSLQPDSAHTRHTIQNMVDRAMLVPDPAAADWLWHRLSSIQDSAVDAREDPGETDPFLPHSGLYLSWFHHELNQSARDRIRVLQALPRAGYGDSVRVLLERMVNDVSFRDQEVRRRSEQGTGLSLDQQRQLAEFTFPRGRANGYATLIRNILTGEGFSAASLAPIERAIQTDSSIVVGSVGGGFPGLISLVTYLRSDDNRVQVVILFLEKLPMAVFYHLLQTGIDKGFVLQLLMDEPFREHVRHELGTS